MTLQGRLNAVRSLGWCCVVSIGLVTSCTTGPLKVDDVHYYKASSGDRANYFRLTVSARTRLGDAEYRSGWFPARSVDSLFGEVTSEGGTKAIQVREALAELINTNVFITTRQWMDAAITNAPQTVLDKINEARRNVLSFPVARPNEGMVWMDYDPMSGLVKRHSDEKFVILLSSNPDEVVGKIAAFTEEEKTVMTIEKLSGAFLQHRSEDVIARSAVEAERKGLDGLLSSQLQAASEALDPENTSVDDAIDRVRRILNLIEAAKP